MKDWRRRAAALLRLAGQPLLVAGDGPEEAGFLEDQLACREALVQARAAGDAAALQALAARARARLAALEAECGRLFAAPERAPPALLAIARCLAQASYHDRLLAEAGRDADAGAPPPGAAT